jgi:hypothetical protein
MKVFLEKLRKVITKSNKLSPWTKKALQFDQITHGRYLKIFMLNVNSDIKNHIIAKTQGKIRNTRGNWSN